MRMHRLVWQENQAMAKHETCNEDFDQVMAKPSLLGQNYDL